MKIALKLADVDAYELVEALKKERSAWIKAAKEDHRRETEAEKATICILTALERTILRAANASDPEYGNAGAVFPKP